MLKHAKTSKNYKPVQTQEEHKTRLSDLSKSSIKNNYLRRQLSLVKAKSHSPLKEASRKLISTSFGQLSFRARSCCIQSTGASSDLYSTKICRKQSMRKFVQTKNSRSFCNWSTDDLCEWLRVNGLDREDMLAIQFRSSQINGSQLIDPEAAWEQMNRFTFKDDEHKQEVMLKIAECIRESKGAEKKTTRPQSSNRPNSSYSKSSSSLNYSRESVMSSSDNVNGSSLSVSTIASTTSDQDFITFGTSSSSSLTSLGKKRLSKSFNSKNTTTIKIQHSLSENEIPSLHQLQQIKVYCDANSSGQFSAVELLITKTTATLELIQLFLDHLSLTEDINLFILSEVSYPVCDNKESVSEQPPLSQRVLKKNEFPLAVYKSFFNSKQTVLKRLELTQIKGIMITVTCRIANFKPRNKQFRVFTRSGIDHVVKLALRKFRLRNVDPGLFALCEVSVSGDFVEIDKSTKKNWQSGSTFVLCDRPSLDMARKDSIRSHSFHRTSSTISHSSQASEVSSSSDSWLPVRLDKQGILGNEIYSFASSETPNDDIIVNELTSNGKEDSNSDQHCSDAKSLTVENAILRAQLREQDEQMREMHSKVAEVRRVLECGLQQYHDDALQPEGVNLTTSSIALENELKLTEKLINDSENMLGQLFRYQRRMMSNRSGSSPTKDGMGLEDFYTTDLSNVASESDIELRIASHQADLLALKHRHHLIDMKMNLFMASRKTEKFRRMITGSLYDVVTSNRAENCFRNTKINPESVYTLHTCEIFPSSSGYGLVMKDNKGISRNISDQIKGTVLDCEFQQGNFLEGDRIVEVNGVNVQTCGSDFVARLLKDTSVARVVVLRRSSLSHNNNNEEKNMDDQEDIIPSPTEEEDHDVISNRFKNHKFVSNGAGVDWREVNALQNDLAMIMRELEVTSCAKRDLERDLALIKSRDILLEKENARLKKQVEDLSRSRTITIDYASSC